MSGDDVMTFGIEVVGWIVGGSMCIVNTRNT